MTAPATPSPSIRLSTTTTVTSFNGGSSELPFFTDGYQDIYRRDRRRPARRASGLAGRISVNGALVDDPSKLVVYGAGVAAGDSTRAGFPLQAAEQRVAAILAVQPASARTQFAVLRFDHAPICVR